VSARIELRGASVAPEAEWHVLAADSLQVRNGFATPDAIRPRREVVRGGPSFELSLPRQSVSVLVVTAAAARSGR
jgi:alpha-L-arabinofuranosidase